MVEVEFSIRMALFSKEILKTIEPMDLEKCLAENIHTKETSSTEQKMEMVYLLVI